MMMMMLMPSNSATMQAHHQLIPDDEKQITNLARKRTPASLQTARNVYRSIECASWHEHQTNPDGSLILLFFIQKTIIISISTLFHRCQ